MPTTWQPSDIGADPDDYATGQIAVKDASGVFVPGASGGAASGERLVQDGTSPPVDLTLEDESDYLYEDI